MATIDLENHFLAATEAAAIAAAAWRGKGDGKAADGAAVEAMRAIFDQVPFDGRVALVAQVVEQSPEKACVGGSSPPQGTKSKLECYILKLAINLKIY